MLRLWNVFYGTFHFIVTGGALLWVYRRFPVSYRKWRNTLAFTTALALLGFVLYPLMPPRLLTACTEFGQCLAGYGYVDTLREVGGLWSFESEGMEAVSRPSCAAQLPSLHFAWSLWSCFVLYPHVRQAPGPAPCAVAYPVATLFAIVVTGNHYWIDAVGGALILAVGYVLGVALTRWTDRRRSRRTGTAAPDLQLRA
ncbi:MAG: phosphatase PAP2 family protein [Acidimicrobiia bacterium]|nr:phosphatase PAP2 family protein [Acidimicrobiia bacterium]